MWAGASQSHGGILATLSELVNASTMVTELGAEAQRLMTEEVVPHK